MQALTGAVRSSSGNPGTKRITARAFLWHRRQRGALLCAAPSSLGSCRAAVTHRRGRARSRSCACLHRPAGRGRPRLGDSRLREQSEKRFGTAKDTRKKINKRKKNYSNRKIISTLFGFICQFAGGPAARPSCSRARRPAWAAACAAPPVAPRACPSTMGRLSFLSPSTCVAPCTRHE